MNEFERKLSQQVFRTPPSELREALFGAAVPREPLETEERWKWQDWFWPAPQAWGALAALWIVFAVMGWGESRPTSPSTPRVAEKATRDDTFTALHSPQALHHALSSLN